MPAPLLLMSGKIELHKNNNNVKPFTPFAAELADATLAEMETSIRVY